MTRSVSIASAVVGEGEPCFIVAEAGVNHDGDPTTAHRLIELAARCGANAVKFQMFDPALVVSAAAEPASYQREATGASTQRRLLDSLVLPGDVWPELCRHAADAGLVFLCTPFDRSSTDVLDSLGVAAFKIPSGELDNLRFIEDVAARGRPLLISTGMATLEEVRTAVEAAARAPGICLFHCVTAYPTPIGACNLRAIPALAAEVGVPVGWSDHTTGATSAVAAVALGAALLEKHVTLDRSRPGPDHAASADEAEFAAYVTAVRDVEHALGDGVKRPLEIEVDNRRLVRRSLHAARDLVPGERLLLDDVVALRPTGGLEPHTHVEGLVVVRSVLRGHPITVDDVRSGV